ncbi:uterocalin-like [Neomonachus schauinslandi]|uniref:Uterocalin-like n=1 Tax=Neomonachus schauinslandi TaxID=29088 RepID=A0A2Y9HAF2_NEOSC|nr:uterocalin-like [Neomonachus schauinslandi]
MNTPWLVLVLALLGGPHALHTGPRDPNIDENMVNGDWFSIAQASDEPKLLWKDSHMMFFVRKIHVTLKTIEFHLYRRFADAGHNMIFLEEVDPSSLPHLLHPQPLAQETVVVNLLSRTPTASCDVMQKFRNDCKSHGISPANIINLTRTGSSPFLETFPGVSNKGLPLRD